MLVLFAILLAIGVRACMDYGVSADEPTTLRLGLDTFAYLFHGGPEPTFYDWTFYNPLISFLKVVVIKALYDSAPTPEVWYLIHGFNFLELIIAVFCFWRIARRLKGEWWLPLLGCLFFIVSPRIFAHGMVNPKDMPALMFFTVALLTLVRLREKVSLGRLVLHALVCALLLSVRSAVGLFAIAMTLWAMLSLRWRDEKMDVRSIAVRGVGFLLATAALTVLVWPRLWSDPLRSFWMALTDNVTRGGGALYFGELTAGTPWHYVFVWMGVTLPLLYTALALIGTIAVLLPALRPPLATMRMLPDRVLFFLWYAGPLLAMIVFRVGIFNEWRHVLFLSPGFLLLALIGVQELLALRWKIARAVTAIAIVLSLGSTLTWMIRNHPFEFVYFSVPTSWIDQRFETDYWSLSYRPALRELLAMDGRDLVRVYAVERLGESSALSLPLDEWRRLAFVEPSRAEYILDVVQPGEAPKLSLADAVRLIKVDGLLLLVIYRGPDTKGVFPVHAS